MILFNQLRMKREIQRALVVKWSLSGISYRQIIKLLNVSLGFISKWNSKILICGVKKLKMWHKGLFMFFLNRQIFGFPKLYMYG